MRVVNKKKHQPASYESIPVTVDIAVWKDGIDRRRKGMDMQLAKVSKHGN